MRLLVNENLPRLAVEGLRATGHDVAWVREHCSGLSDVEVLQRAQTEERVLVTMDKDFAALAFRHRLPAASGVVLVRVPAQDPTQLAKIVVRAMSDSRLMQGHLVTGEPDRIRIRALPRQAAN